MAYGLWGSKIAILAADGFERPDLLELLDELVEEGAEIDIVAPDARAESYDAILLAGGAERMDQLRVVEGSMSFVRDFFAAKKPTAVICHGPWTMIEARAEAAAWPSFKAVDRCDVDSGELDEPPSFRGWTN